MPTPRCGHALARGPSSYRMRLSSCGTRAELVLFFKILLAPTQALYDFDDLDEFIAGWRKLAAGGNGRYLALKERRRRQLVGAV